MRLLLGIILGFFLTVGAAYVTDNHVATATLNPPAGAERPMVNWDVVNIRWHKLTDRARTEWHKLASR